jgi:hypothetical protein
MWIIFLLTIWDGGNINFFFLTANDFIYNRKKYKRYSTHTIRRSTDSTLPKQKVPNQMITFSRTNQNTLPLNELYNQTALHTTHKIDMVKRLSWQVTISKKRL